MTLIVIRYPCVWNHRSIDRRPGFGIDYGLTDNG